MAEGWRRLRARFEEPRWVALWAAMLGYLLDAMDVLLYSFALQAIRTEFSLSLGEAGLVTSATMLASAAGGIAAGVAADRIGRRNTLIYTILLYSLASGGSALATGLPSLIFWRSLVGLGLGGEWSAGAALVAESWPAQHRAKAIGVMQSGWALGYMAAALLSALVLPRYGWRVLFLVGTLPALLTVMIRRKVSEPPIWEQQRGRHPGLRVLFQRPLRRTTIAATGLATCVLLAYWGVFSWLPGFLAGSRETGGAGMTAVRSGLWLFLMQVGALAGYLCFGILADRAGRKPAFRFYVICAAILTPIYGLSPRWSPAEAERLLLILGPAMGFFGTGYFSLFGAMLAELFPTPVRATGQGFTYNFGRSVSALAPYAVGAVAGQAGFGVALALNSAFFLLAALLISTLPETRGANLESVR